MIGKCSYIEAVESPRCHWEDNVFHLEPGFQDVENLSLAEGTIAIFWQEKNLFFGGVNAVTDAENEVIEVGGDSRCNTHCGNDRATILKFPLIVSKKSWDRRA